MAVRTARFYASSNAPAVATTVYTVPSGHRALIKFVSVWNSSAGNREFYLFHGSGSASTVMLRQAVIPAATLVLWNCFHVLNQGELLRVFASGADLHVNVTGADLVL